MNQITHWLDGSNIYGSNEGHSRDLRLGSRGMLKFQTAPDGGQLLPEDSGTKVKCTKSGSAKCFKAGRCRVASVTRFARNRRIFLVNL